MAKEVRIKLTDAQRSKIKSATGKNMTEIRVTSLGKGPAANVASARSVARGATSRPVARGAASRPVARGLAGRKLARAITNTRASRAQAGMEASARQSFRAGDSDSN